MFEQLSDLEKEHLVSKVNKTFKDKDLLLTDSSNIDRIDLTGCGYSNIQVFKEMNQCHKLYNNKYYISKEVLDFCSKEVSNIEKFKQAKGDLPIPESEANMKDFRKRIGHTIDDGFFKDLESTINFMSQLKKVEFWSVDKNTLEVNVKGDVRLDLYNFNKLPIQFGKVTGDFIIANSSLTSLKGSPKEVGGNFYFANNKITSLKDGPEIVNGSYFGEGNKLETAEYLPAYVGKHFQCDTENIPGLGKNASLQDLQKEQFKIQAAKEKSILAQQIDFPEPQKTTSKQRMKI